MDETGAASGDGDATPVVDAFQDDWPDSISDDSGTAITGTTATTATDGSCGLGHPSSGQSVLTVGAGRQRSPTDRFIMQDEHLVSPGRALPGFQNLTLAGSESIPAAIPMVIPFEMEAEDPEVRAMRARIYRDKDVWPLESREEAMLFRHFIQRLSICVSSLTAGPRPSISANAVISCHDSLTYAIRISHSRLSFRPGQELARF